MDDHAHARPGPEELLQHEGFVRGLARTLVADAATADDLSQEAFATALEAPPAHSGNLRGWFARILRNRLRTRVRSERRRAAREARAPRPPGPVDPAAAVAQAEIEHRLLSAVLALDEPFRSAIVLRYFRGLSVAGVAEALGVPEKTASSRLSRGVARLRAELDRAPGGREAWRSTLLPLAAAPALRRSAVSLGGSLVTGKLLFAGGAAVVACVVAATVFSLASPSEPALAPPPSVTERPAPPPADDPPVAAPAPAAPAPGSSVAAAAPAASPPDSGPVAAANTTWETSESIRRRLIEPFPEDGIWHLDLRVTADDAPATGARVRVEGPQGAGVADGVTDTDGRSEFTLRGPGPFVVRAELRGWTGATSAEAMPGMKFQTEDRRRIERILRLSPPDPFGAGDPLAVTDPMLRGRASSLVGGRGGHRNLRTNGGGARTQEAVDAALAWLARAQFDDGSWDADPLRTSLALLAFLGAGQTHRHGDHRETVRKALARLAGRQRADGRFADDAEANATAAQALAEAYLLTASSKLKPVALRGLAALAAAEAPADPAALLAEARALGVAAALGYPVDRQAVSDRLRRLAALPDSDRARRGVVLFLRSILGEEAADAAAVDRLRRDPPDGAHPDPLGWFHGSLALIRVGGEAWKEWNEAAVEAILPFAETDGSLAGSFPSAGPDARRLGRAGTTAVFALALEVYYLYAPPRPEPEPK